MRKTLAKTLGAAGLAAMITTVACAESSYVSNATATSMPVQSYVPFDGSVDLNSNHLLKRGIQNYLDGDYATASMLLHRAMRGSTNNALGSYFMGLTKAKIGNTRGAIKYLKSANRAYSNAPQSYAALGEAYAKIGKTDKAQNVLARLNALETCAVNCASAEDIAAARSVIQKALSQ